MTDKYIMSNDECEQRAKEIARKIHQLGWKKTKLYGIPRGGVPAVILVHKHLPNSEILDDPKDADVFIDDIIDSGKTMRQYMDKYKTPIGFALVNKLSDLVDKGLGWIVFPWDAQAEGSADDVPVRLLQYIGEDPQRGGLLETPKRFLKAWDFFTSGYAKDVKDVLKVFEDGAENYDEMVLVKNIPLYSQCEHHLVPFFGVAHIAYIPDGKVVGLSKLSRITDIFARRLQVQERLTNQIAQALEDNLQPKGVAVVLECRHLCMEARGVCQQGHTTVTSSMKGAFMSDNKARTEFMGLIK